ncbi:MAG: YihY/virulence factor BrkB family protein [Ferruginibacter sp.]
MTKVFYNIIELMRKRLITFFHFNKQVIVEYFADNVIKYSASLAYYTTLSLAPMLVILISVSGILFGKEAMKGQVYSQMNGMIGNDAAAQIQTTMQQIHLSKDTPIATIISAVILIIGATGIFGEMQDSLNKIWGLKTIGRKVWWKLILNRLLSFSIIICMGFVLMVSLILNAVVAAISGKLNTVIHGIGDTLIPVVDYGLSIGITLILFATIFKVLPDAKIKWKDVFVGALITAILFMLGKLGIGYYLSKSNLATVFGAAGSVIIIMIWVYYSSAILYLGAVFTKVYATDFGGKIYPNDYATWIRIEQVPVADVSLAKPE